MDWDIEIGADGKVYRPDPDGHYAALERIKKEFEMKPKISIITDTYVEEPMEELKPYEQNYKKSEKNIDEEFDKAMDSEIENIPVSTDFVYLSDTFNKLIKDFRELNIKLYKAELNISSLTNKIETLSNKNYESLEEIKLQRNVNQKLLNQIELLTNQNEELSNKLNKRNVIIDFLYTLVEASFVEGYYSRTLFSFLKDKYSHSKNSFKNSYITRRIEEIKSDNLD